MVDTNFDLSDEEQMIRETVRRFAEEQLRPIAGDIDESMTFPKEPVDALAEMGILGICFPEEYGGAGGSTLSYAIAVEELCRVCASTGITLAAHVSLGCSPIYYAGTEEQKQKWLPDLCAGKHLGSFGLTEPEAGSDAAGTRSTARLEGDEWVLNGTKQFITNATYAGILTCTFVTEPEAKGTRRISAIVVPTDAPGFSLGKKENKMGIRASDTRELVFEDCRVPKENLLGERGHGFPVFMQTLDGGRISIGAMALGIAQGAYEEAVKYARERKQFGKPIGAFQSIAFKIADMATEIDAARHLIYHAARLKDLGRPYSREAAMAKLFASEVAGRVTDQAVQIHGGYGYIKEYPVERFFRDAKLTQIGEGTSEIQRLVISRQVLGRL